MKRKNEGSASKVPFEFFQDGIHFNKTIERAVLGLCLIDPSATDIITGILEPKHFYISDNRMVADAIMKIAKRGSPVDVFSVMHELNSEGILEISDKNVPAHLASLTNGVTSSAGITGHAYALVDLWKHRRIIELTSRNHMVGDNPAEILAELERSIAELRHSSGAYSIGASDLIMKVYEYQERTANREIIGVTTGLMTVDKFTGGFEDGCLYVIAARPSVGKSALMGRCVLGAAKTGKQVGIIQLEMSVQQTGIRLASLYSDMEYLDIINGLRHDEEERERFYTIMGGMSGLPLHVNPHGSLNLEAIKSWAHSMKHAGKLDILFIDYLQLIDSPMGRSREQDVSAISRGLKVLARTLNIPVVALSQLNRAIEARANKRPVLSDLRESGAIEQDADAVYFLHRDYAMGIETDAQGNSTENEAELIFAKNRNGPRGSLPLKYDGTKMKFYEPDWFDQRSRPE